MADDNRLETALKAALADAAAQGVFETALLTETLYLSPSDGVPPEGQVLGRDRPFDIQGVTVEGGARRPALFTSVERLRAAMGAAAPVMGMRGLHALEALRRDGLALNPGAPPGLVMDPRQIEAVLVDVRDLRAGTAAGMTLTAPDREPTALVGRLKAAVSLPRVTGAWLARASWPGEPDGWYLDVRGAVGLAEVRRRVTEAVTGLDFHGEPLELGVGPDGGEGVGLRLV